MKKILIALMTIMVLSLSCVKNNIKLNDVISPLGFSTQKISADGTTVVTITAKLNPNADSIRRMVTFTASSGSFLGGKDSTITKNAVFSSGNLISQVQFKAPFQPGTITIKAQVALASDRVGYIQSDTINAARSVPTKIALQASSFAVKINFGSEVTLTGKLTNSVGNPVSLGNQVVFEDTYDDGSPVNGRFRQPKLTSDSTSSVSVIYSPGNVPINKNIHIACTMLGTNGSKTNITDNAIVSTISN